MTQAWMNEDVVEAVVDLAGRVGAASFEIGYLHEDVPIEEAGWYAHVQYRGARVTVGDQTSPSGAALGLAERLLRGATCRCGRPVSLSDTDAGACRWRLVGKRWEPGCDTEPIHVQGKPGDYAAMTRAFGNRAARRRRGGR